jgi:hypothetical protein
MNKRTTVILILVTLTIVLMMLYSCTSNSSTTTSPTKSVSATTTTSETISITSTGPGGGAIVNSDSVITGTINAIRKQSSGYPWEVDVFIKTSENVGDLPNPTADKVGQAVTMKTDQDMTEFSAGEPITARVKYTGDVPKPGITLYIYKIALA